MLEQEESHPASRTDRCHLFKMDGRLVNAGCVVVFIVVGLHSISQLPPSRMLEVRSCIYSHSFLRQVTSPGIITGLRFHVSVQSFRCPGKATALLNYNSVKFSHTRFSVAKKQMQTRKFDQVPKPTLLLQIQGLYFLNCTWYVNDLHYI